MLVPQTSYASLMRTLADLVRQARVGKKWSQETAAEHIGVERNWIAQLETERIDLPSRERLELLERHLGISREEMLRAAGYLGPAAKVDLMAEFRRISVIADLEDQMQALEALPPDVFVALEAMAHRILRQRFRQDERQGTA